MQGEPELPNVKAKMANTETAEAELIEQVLAGVRRSKTSAVAVLFIDSGAPEDQKTEIETGVRSFRCDATDFVVMSQVMLRTAIERAALCPCEGCLAAAKAAEHALKATGRAVASAMHDMIGAASVGRMH